MFKAFCFSISFAVVLLCFAVLYTVEFQKFLVFPWKYVFRPVEGHLMIKFIKRTELVERTGMEAEFPFCTHALTPIAQLPRPTDMPERFTSDFVTNHLFSRLFGGDFIITLLCLLRCHWSDYWNL